jgi:hypothetical protein
MIQFNFYGGGGNLPAFCFPVALAAVNMSAILLFMKYHGWYFSVLTIPKHANFTISLASYG